MTCFQTVIVQIQSLSMATRRLPAFFVSHGAPTMAAGKEPVKTVEFLRSLGKQLLAEKNNVKALLVVSAHWESMGKNQLEITSFPGENPIIYDFYGFPDELYKLRFKSHGSPEWSQQIAELLTEKHQIPTVCTDKRGLDHGCWAPLRLMFPGDAGSPFPVIQLSLNNTLDYEFHLRLGKALRELRQQGLVIIGSGGLVHNLGAICWDKPEGDSLPWVSKFAVNIIQLSEQPGFDKLLLKFAQNHVAEIQQAHPRTEHFMPLFVTAGCVIDEEEHLKAVHDHTVYGTLRLTAFQTLQ